MMQLLVRTLQPTRNKNEDRIHYANEKQQSKNNHFSAAKLFPASIASRVKSTERKKFSPDSIGILWHFYHSIGMIERTQAALGEREKTKM